MTLTKGSTLNFNMIMNSRALSLSNSTFSGRPRVGTITNGFIRPRRLLVGHFTVTRKVKNQGRRIRTVIQSSANRKFRTNVRIRTDRVSLVFGRHLLLTAVFMKLHTGIMTPAVKRFGWKQDLKVTGNVTPLKRLMTRKTGHLKVTITIMGLRIMIPNVRNRSKNNTDHQNALNHQFTNNNFTNNYNNDDYEDYEGDDHRKIL